MAESEAWGGFAEVHFGVVLLKIAVGNNGLFPLQNTKVFAFCKKMGGTADFVRPFVFFT